jgi:Flp pilus assembly protein TadD
MTSQFFHARLAIDSRRSGLSLMALALSMALAGCAAQNNNSGNNAGAIMSAPTGAIGPNTLNVADAAIAGGDPSMALSVSQSILSTDPDNVDALVHEGQAYYALNRCPPSEAAFQQALKADPKSSDAEVGLGRCLLKVDPRSAEAAFLAATQDDPGNAAAFSDLGVARDLQNNFAGAAQAYQQSLSINAGSTPTAVNLGLSLALSGQGEEALQYLGPIATGPEATPKIREDYAVALVAAGRTDDARQVLAVDMTPDQANAALAGFQNLVSQSVTAPPPPGAPVATQPQVQTAPVTESPVSVQSSSAPVMLAPTDNSSSSAASSQYAASAAPAAAPVAPPPPPVAAPAPAPVAQSTANTGVPPIASATITPVSDQVSAPVAAKPVSTHAPAKQTAPVQVASAAPPAPMPAPAPAPKPEAAPAAPAQPETAMSDSSAASADPAATPASMPVGASHASVQIAALNSEDAAHAEWRLVSSKAPGLFAGKAPEISKVAVGGQTYYRLRVTGFSSHQDAVQFCSQITAAGGTCMPANF